jgi:hypothetical protein
MSPSNSSVPALPSKKGSEPTQNSWPPNTAASDKTRDKEYVVLPMNAQKNMGIDTPLTDLLEWFSSIWGIRDDRYKAVQTHEKKRPIS